MSTYDVRSPNQVHRAESPWPPTVVLASWGRYCQTPPVQRLAEFLRQRGVRVLELEHFPDGSVRCREWRREGPEFHVDNKPPSRARRSFRFLSVLRRVAREVDESTLWVFLDVHALLLGWMLGIGRRRLFYCLDYSPPASRLLEPVYRRLGAVAIARVDLVWAAEEAKVAPFRPATANRADVIWNAPTRSECLRIREARLRKTDVLRRYGVPDGATVLIHAGGVADDFGIREEIEATCLLTPDVYLILMGRIRCSLENRPRRVILVGEVSDEVWLTLLGAADVGLALWTPRQRNNGYARYNTPQAWNRLYWYLAAGLPVIAGGHDSLRQFLAETGAGIFLNCVNVAAVAQAIGEALTCRVELSVRATSAFFEVFNFESQMERIVERLGSIWLGR